jgi:hypothetical protein
MRNLKLLSVMAACMMLVVFSCKKSSDDSNTITDINGLSQQIHNLVPDSVLTKMKNNGMPIDTGINPPNFQNIYLATPIELVSTTWLSDSYYAGETMGFDFKVQFYNQNNSNLTVELNDINGSETETGIGSFISGSGNNFTVFAKTTTTLSGATAETVEVITGTVVSGGLQDMYIALYMLNNGGRDDIYIPNGTGRIFKDIDGFSELQSSFKSVKAAIASNKSMVSSK